MSANERASKWDRHKKRHPLLLLFDYARMSEFAGMDWLQGRGMISDNCVGVFDIAECDVRRVLEMARESRELRGLFTPSVNS